VIVVDAMNVIGSVPDGWWKDRHDALRRLVDAVAGHGFDEWVVVVADGRPVDGVPAGTRGDLELRYAGRSDPDAADDDIVALVDDLDDGEPVTVVTSDRGLIDRLPPGTNVEGARAFRRRVGW
jgi:hypothetical protein